MSCSPSRAVSLAIACLCAAPLSSQVKKVVPPEYAGFEAGSRFAFPFAKTSAQMQILTDGKLVSNGPGFLAAIGFRPDKPLTTTAGYTKKYRVTLYPTAVVPAAMTTNPVTNIGSAKGTVVFDGSLSVPTVPAQLTAPARSFALRIPANALYPFDGATKNLLVHLETRDMSAVSKWYPDAVSRGNPGIRAEKSVVGLGCSYSPSGAGSYSLRMSIGSAAYLGGSLDVTLKRSPSTTPIGTWPTAVLGLDASITRPGYPMDMTRNGMPGCNLFIAAPYTWFVGEQSSGAYPAVNLSIPNLPGLAGTAFFAQALGASPGGSLVGSVLTDAWQVVLAPNPPSASRVEAVYESNGRWLGAFGTIDLFPVVEYDGILR